MIESQPAASRSTASVLGHSIRRDAVRTGFTMIEILVAVSVIAILMTIVIAGFNYAARLTRNTDSRTMLQNAASMLAEYETQLKFRQQPRNWGWRDLTGYIDVTDPAMVNSAAAKDNKLNFWTQPVENISVLPADRLQADEKALDAPDYVDPESSINALANRLAHHAIINTQLAMAQIVAVPSARKMLAGLPGDRLMSLDAPPSSVNPQIPAALSHTLGLDGSDRAIDPPNYCVGNLVRTVDPAGTADAKLWRYAGNSTTFSTNAAPVFASGGTGWELVGGTDDRAAPLLLDGFGNPIILVPATGLNVRFLGTADRYGEPGTVTQTIISPDGRPFWASAGADGSFARGDDNIYSFED